jgi:signal peptidase I
LSKKDWKRETIVTLIFIVIIAGVILGGFQLLRMYLNTDAPFRIISNQPSSMEPTMYYGDIGVIKHVPGYDIFIGDVIVFSPYHWILYGSVIPPAPVMHRVINVKFENGTFWYQTKGDNPLTNPSPDPGWTPYWFVHGKVIMTIPRVGAVAVWFYEGGYLFVIVTLTIITVIYVVWELQKEELFSDNPNVEPD